MVCFPPRGGHDTPSTTDLTTALGMQPVAVTVRRHYVPPTMVTSRQDGPTTDGSRRRALLRSFFEQADDTSKPEEDAVGPHENFDHSTALVRRPSARLNLGNANPSIIKCPKT